MIYDNHITKKRYAAGSFAAAKNFSTGKRVRQSQKGNLCLRMNPELAGAAIALAN